MRKTALSILLGATSVVAVLLPQHATAAQSRTASTQASVLTSDSDRGRPGLGGPGDFINCPAGSTPWPFDMPIYDADGLFVIGYETVWYCIPDDLEPAR